MTAFQSDLIATFQTLIENSKNLVIVSHKSPDGDSVGSSMALYHYLKNKGIQANISVCYPDPAPSFLLWADEANIILNYEQQPVDVTSKLTEADLIICLDFNDFSRVGELMEPVLKSGSAKKIMIDHHLNPVLDQFDLVFSFPDRSSTCELLMEVMLATDHDSFIDKKVAERLYLGIVTDTGSFRFNSVSPKTHHYAAMLMSKGLKHTQVHERTFDDNTLERLQLRSYILLSCMELWEEFNTAVLYLTMEDANRFNMKKGDTEGLANVALSIQGIQCAAFFKEEKDHIKISFRSKESFPVHEIASIHFHGGGHRQAAGGRFDGTLIDAMNAFKRVLSHE
jgi:phosphoesterase RecJ-like protein